MKPKELEKRLGVAYDAGFFDGYCAAIDTIHQTWAAAVKNTKGIGPIISGRVHKSMYEEYAKMRANQGGDEATRQLVEESSNEK